MTPEDPKIKYFRFFGLSGSPIGGFSGGIVARPSDRNPRETHGSKKQMFFPQLPNKQQPVAAAIAATKP